MKLSEMLATVGGPQFLDDRVARVSGVSDELYSDDDITLHLNEAQRILCQEAWVLEDTTTPACCEIQLVENQTDYALDPSVLGIKAIRLSDSDVDLLRVNYYDNRLHAGDALDEPSYWNVNTTTLETPGRPSRWSADMGTATIRLRQKPDATAAALTAKLTVVRLPLTDLTTSALTASPEVKPQYHMLLCKYAAAQLGASGDPDSGIPAKARNWQRQWEAGLENASKYRRRLQNAMPRFRFGGWARGR